MEALINALAGNGLLGLLLAISLLGNFHLLRLLLGEKDKRIVGAEKVRDDLIAPIGFIRDSVELIQQKIKISKAQE